MTDSAKPLSRSEREAKIKDKAGWVITVLAALLAINTLVGGGNSSKILNNTIAANNTWAFYQAKSIKQTAYEIASVQAADAGNPVIAEKYAAKAASYESEPETGEGKKELMSKARTLDTERTEAKERSPWFTYAGSIFQIAIVLLTASILSVSYRLFQASVVVGTLGALLMSQALWLWLPISL
jgi:spore germination protein GerM